MVTCHVFETFENNRKLSSKIEWLLSPSAGTDCQISPGFTPSCGECRFCQLCTGNSITHCSLCIDAVSVYPSDRLFWTGKSIGVVTLQPLSCVWLFAIPWTAVHQAPLSFTISQSLLKLMPIESVMPSNHLIPCRPLLLLPSIFPSIRVFSNVLAHHIRWPKYWSFSFNISPSNQYSGLISFRILWFVSLLSKGLLRVFSTATVTQFLIMLQLVIPGDINELPFQFNYIAT